MVAIARALSPDRATAEDLAQDSFVTAHKHWDRVGAYDDPRAWVRRVMINRATSLRRRVKAEVRALARAGHDPERGETADLTPATSEVWDEVQRLPRRQQQAMVLHYVGQLSTREIGDALGCSHGAVKTHLHRARETLRAQLHQWRDDEHG
jgi:RNA polymerase sigma-70 factor, ECF subfamily